MVQIVWLWHQMITLNDIKWRIYNIYYIGIIYIIEGDIKDVYILKNIKIRFGMKIKSQSGRWKQLKLDKNRYSEEF